MSTHQALWDVGSAFTASRRVFSANWLFPIICKHFPWNNRNPFITKHFSVVPLQRWWGSAVEMHHTWSNWVARFGSLITSQRVKDIWLVLRKKREMTFGWWNSRKMFETSSNLPSLLFSKQFRMVQEMTNCTVSFHCYQMWWQFERIRFSITYISHANLKQSF